MAAERLAKVIGLRPQYTHPCGKYTAGERHCGKRPTRRFGSGQLCMEHAPIWVKPAQTAGTELVPIIGCDIRDGDVFVSSGQLVHAVTPNIDEGAGIVTVHRTDGDPITMPADLPLIVRREVTA